MEDGEGCVFFGLVILQLSGHSASCQLVGFWPGNASIEIIPMPLMALYNKRV